MLKVVGASWLQTRISTYILVAVALLGLGAIILGEYGRAVNDGTYSASVWWKRRSGYRIDFWGQGNDLGGLPAGAARGYYKTGIHESGWSVVEIETSPEYPDEVQAYAAGLLEGSLTWQLIHQHWSNSVRAACAPRAALCRRLRRYLRENAAGARESAALLRFQEPYWHMIHLFYAQLDGLAEGWRFSAQRRGQDGDIEPEDFLWLAMAADLPELERAGNGSSAPASADGMLVLKAIERPGRPPLLGLAHNTAAPYARMLRLLKRYKFAYRRSPEPGAERVPGQALVMSSYPGALSSQDESYWVGGGPGQLLVAGTPLAAERPGLAAAAPPRLLSAARVMAANRLAVDPEGWSRLLGRNDAGTAPRQWLAAWLAVVRAPRVALVEQAAGLTRFSDRSAELARLGFLGCTGARGPRAARGDRAGARAEQLARLQRHVSSVQGLRDLVSGGVAVLGAEPAQSPEAAAALAQLLAFRGDLAAAPRPLGVIDSKLFLFDGDGLEAFEARSGPARHPGAPAFDWADSFPNSSHLGQPERFAFDSFAPQWVWP